MPASDDPRGSNWRSYLTAQERLDLEGLEVNAQRLDQQRAALTSQITRLRDRCQQRRAYRRRKGGAGRVEAGEVAA